MLNNTKSLGEERIGKLLIDFSIPDIIGMLVNAIYNIFFFKFNISSLFILL